MDISRENIALAAHRQLIGSQLAAGLSSLTGAADRIEINDKAMSDFHIVDVRRTGSGFVLDMDCRYITPHYSSILTHRIVPVLALLRRDDCSAERCIVDFGDHASAPEANITFCCRQEEAGILIPDYDFLGKRGYEQLKHWALANTVAWQARSDVVLWRGETTGNPDLAGEFGGWIPRVRLCLMAREIPQTDMKIIRIVQSRDPAADQQTLVGKGIFQPSRLPVETWVDHKFAVDIDGNASSFGTLLQRQLLGCCVIRVNSCGCWRQWFHDRLRPWYHYVPVSADLSDLEDVISWCRNNDDRCRQIAEQGRGFAESLEYETECRSATMLINSAFPGKIRGVR